MVITEGAGQLHLEMKFHFYSLLKSVILYHCKSTCLPKSSSPELIDRFVPWEYVSKDGS